MKEEILETISMQDVIDKYGIENNGKMFSCPFHGVDKHPSAKIYKNSYCCFTCHSAGDTIRFVENLFNLSFIDAMNKMNIDFGLGLEHHYIDYKKLEELKFKQNEKKRKRKKLTDKFCYLCDLKHCYEDVIKHFSKRINIKNWEIVTYIISQFETKIQIIDEDLTNIDNLLSSRD